MTNLDPQILALFPTHIYRAELQGVAQLNRQLEELAYSLHQQDDKGRRWCQQHGYAGYTSYASITNLSEHNQQCARLAKMIEQQAAKFAKTLYWNLQGGKPRCDSMWLNILPQGGSHTSHLHTNAVLSGTYYVTAAEGASPIVFEDPRHGLKMASPPLKASAPGPIQTYVSLKPRAGTLLLWESWLRHEVPQNQSQDDRISISFNMIIAHDSQ